MVTTAVLTTAWAVAPRAALSSLRTARVAACLSLLPGARRAGLRDFAFAAFRGSQSAAPPPRARARRATQERVKRLST